MYSWSLDVRSWIVALTLTSPRPPSLWLAYSLRVLELGWNPPCMEESGETVSSETNGVALWLCPLCQQGQTDRSSLSLHLTDQHSVLPSCVEKLLDIAGLKQAARVHEATGAQHALDAAASDLKEDFSSGLCQSNETSNSTEACGEKDTEEEKVMAQDKGDLQSMSEEEGQHLIAVKQQATSVKAEIPDAAEKSDVKKVPSENDTKPFKCYACLEAFPNKTALSVHYNSAGHIQRMKTGGEADSQSLPVPTLSRPFVSNKPYQCAVCRVSYNHAITLESHMKSVLHQTRSRNAGIVANSTVATSNTTSVPKTVASKSGNSQLVTATPSSGLMVAPQKDGEQAQTSQVPPSLITSPVASAQAVSAFLTLLTSSPNTLSHSILPSLFAAGATGAAAPQLVPQPQMVMPLILNGLQAQTQQLPENQQSPLLTQCVPFVGLSAAQQALLAQRFSSLQSQWPSVGLPPNMQPSPEEQKTVIKCEKEQDETDEKVLDQFKGNKRIDAVIKKEEVDHSEFAQSPNTKTRMKVDHTEDNGDTHRDGTTDGNSSANQLDLEGDKTASLTFSPADTDKNLRNNNPSPSVSVPSNSSLSPVNLNLTLSPDSTPQKSQLGTSPCGSLGTPKSSPSTNALTKIRSMSVNQDPPVLSEFQSEVLWAFLESRSEADAASPPREDCEALGREVGLSEDEVRRWLTHARLVKQRQKAAGLEHLQALARQITVSDDEEEHSLVIAEGEDEEASGSMVLDLSSTRTKRKRKQWGKDARGDSCLTSDSDNEVYTSIIVSDEESQNGSFREDVESPAKEVAQREIHSDKGAAGGKVLRSTTVFLSDAEEEYEDEEGGMGRRAKKQKTDFEKEDFDIKRERQDSDVDLELEAQADPPSSQIHTLNFPAGALHSLPLSLASFSHQFLSPYVLSLSPSLVGDASKVPVFSNPPTITRFSNSILSQSLAQSQTAPFMSNGGDNEGALDLSMGKGSSKSPSSAISLAEKIAAQKGQLLDGLGLRPTSKGLVVVQVKPELAAPTSNSSMNLVNCNNMTKSAIYMRAAEKMNASLLEKEREKEREHGGEQDSHGGRKAKGKRYRDMRRSRTIIQAEQLDILYGCYFKDPNPGKHEFEQISEWVQLPKKVVQIWFQNMRARERKGEVRFISDGTLAAVGKPLIKFTWPLAKPIFSKKPPTPTNNNMGGIATAPIVRTLIKTDPDPVKEVSKVTMVKKIIPIKPKEVLPSTAVSPLSAAPKTKLETTSNVTMVKVTPKVNSPVILPPPKEPPVVPRPADKNKVEEEEDSEEEVTDEEKDHENQMAHGPGSSNRMVPKLPTTPINNRPSATTTASQKQNGVNYWTPKIPIKINTLSREQLSLPTYLPSRCLAPPPTPSIAPVSPNTQNSAKVTSAPSTPVVAKSSPSDNFLSHSSSRRPRTHLSCLQLSILQSCYETCAHPNCLECEAIGSELNLPLKVVQIWFQNTRAKEKRWKLQQEKMTTPSGEKMDTSSGSYLQYSALKANRPILPKPVHLTILFPASSSVDGQSSKELLTGRCDVCDVSFDSRAAAREHVFSQYHLATLKTTNFGQPVSLINKNGTSNSGSGSGAPAQTVVVVNEN